MVYLNVDFVPWNRFEDFKLMTLYVETEKIHRGPSVGKKKRVEWKTLHGNQMIVFKPRRLLLNASDLENRFKRNLFTY